MLINTSARNNTTHTATSPNAISPSPNANSPSPKHHIFSYQTPDNGHQLITPDHIQTFFQDRYNSYITPKMFRTWYGNYHMLEHLHDLFHKDLLAKRMKTADVNSTVKSCSEYVSSKLNNTPSISRKSYIDNKLLALVMRNPYRIAAQIPNNKDDQHQFLYKLILKLRQ
jgi:DNA topoisomerase IB